MRADLSSKMNIAFQGNGAPASSRSKVFIIDDFAGNEPDKGVNFIEGNDDALFTHGQLVESVFRSAFTNNRENLPEIVREDKPDLSYNTVGKINNGDYVNCSFSNDFDELWGESEAVLNLQKRVVDLSKVLSKIARKAKLYVSAGNKRKLNENIYSLVPNATVVRGMGSCSSEPLMRESHHAAPFTFEGELLKDAEGNPYGYDVYPKWDEGDGVADLFIYEVPLQVAPPFEGIKDKIEFSGTSFSAPYKLGKDYQAHKEGYAYWSPFLDQFIGEYVA